MNVQFQDHVQTMLSVTTLLVRTFVHAHEGIVEMGNLNVQVNVLFAH